MSKTNDATSKFHFSKLIRRQEVQKRKKKRKLLWLRKMYEMGKQAEDKVRMAVAVYGDEGGDGDGDGDGDGMLPI